MNHMGFAEALNLLKDGAEIYREGWNGKGMWVELQTPTENSKMTKPYIYINTPTGAISDGGNMQFDRVPWLASQADLLATDWKCK